MPEKDDLISDIIENHSQRMSNLKKYYPFFRLQESAFALYKEGRYSDLDMGYITMATLRYFIEENSFKEKKVTYEQVQAFLKELLVRDFALTNPEEEQKELVRYIFDKIKNDGKPFYFTYFDPKDHKKKTSRVKFIESEMEEETVYYSITADGIAFYLDTKEVRDESEISIQQLLLEKMIHARNFKGGLEVVRRINAEVSKLSLKKREVIEILESDVYEGVAAYENYMQHVAKWFEEEEKMFTKNKKLIALALKKTEGEAAQTGNRQRYFKILEEIYELEAELKKTIERHARLITETMNLTMITDSVVGKAKLRRLRPVFDFQKQMEYLKQQDRADKLEVLLMPLLRPKAVKSFPFENLDHLLSNRPEAGREAEHVEEEEGSSYVYPDELEETRISENYHRLAMVLFDQIKRKGRISLKELNGLYEIKYGKQVLKNADYYSFFVHLCQKPEYQVTQMLKKQDTFLEGILAGTMNREEKERYELLAFTLQRLEEDEIEAAPGCLVSNIIFERTNV